MQIGIDVDGVLTDLWKYQCKAGEHFFHRAPVEPEKLSVREMFGCSKAAELLFWVCSFPGYCRNCPPREDAPAALRRLAGAGHRLYLITSRKFSADNTVPGRYSRAWLRDWLARNGLPFTDIRFCAEKNVNKEKLAACRQLGVDCMIEDSPAICSYLADRGVRVLVFDAPYNRMLAGPNLIRVTNWQDICTEMVRIQKENTALSAEKKKSDPPGEGADTDR